MSEAEYGQTAKENCIKRRQKTTERSAGSDDESVELFSSPCSFRWEAVEENDELDEEDEPEHGADDNSPGRK